MLCGAVFGCRDHIKAAEAATSPEEKEKSSVYGDYMASRYRQYRAGAAGFSLNVLRQIQCDGMVVCFFLLVG